QKKLTLIGPRVRARTAASSARRPSTPSKAEGSDPSPPASLTAAASALPCTPAIGAWTIGKVVPNGGVIASPPPHGPRVPSCVNAGDAPRVAPAAMMDRHAASRSLCGRAGGARGSRVRAGAPHGRGGSGAARADRDAAARGGALQAVHGEAP